MATDLKLDHDVRSAWAVAPITMPTLNMTLPRASSAVPLLVHRWEDRARIAPDHEAVRADAHASLTYGMASRLAHRWAQVWQEQGVNPGDRVLVRCPAGPVWVVAVWAAGLAGLCWTPCAPDVPPEQADLMLHDLDPRLVVDASSTLEQPVVVHRPISHLPTPPGTACIVYTRGSVGRPNGVVVLHEGLLPLVEDLTRTLAVDASTVALWMRPPTSDLSLATVAPVLAAGGTLVVEPAHAWRHFDVWERLVHRHGITQADPPSSSLIAWAHQAPPSGLQTVLVGSGAAPTMLARSWSMRLRWINLFGGPETSVCSGLERLRRIEGAPASRERPVHGLTYRVLPVRAVNADVEQVTEGELWVGGAGVADGYWRRPALSARRFWTDSSGTRWVRTGQAVRRAGAAWLRLGPLPQRVIRQDHALDLDEVESVLQNLPGLQRVHVWQTTTEGQGLLVAAVQGEHDTSLFGWKMQAAERLPAWAVPQHWWWADDWPLTRDGATDVPALQQQWARQGHLAVPMSGASTA